MNKHRNQELIQNALNATLSGLQDDPWLAQRVMAEVKKPQKVKRKISSGVAFILVSVFLAATALAVVAIREVAWWIAQTEQENGSWMYWPVEKKIEVIIGLMDQGYIADKEIVHGVQNEDYKPGELNRVLDNTISEFTGKPVEEIGFLEIMQSAWGPFDTWTDEDKAWYSTLMEDVGINSEGKTVYVLPDGKITKEQAVEIARLAIAEGFGVELEELEAYEVITNFQIPEFLVDGNQAYWYVMLKSTSEMEDSLFQDIELFIHPETGELLQNVSEILDIRANLPQRADNDLYQARNAYFDRAEQMGVYSFRDWPLELRAEYSRHITPWVNAIIESGNLIDLMNGGNLDIQFIAQSTYVYGIPQEDAISQEEAYELATDALMKKYGMPADIFKKYRKVNVYYDITDKPKWKFFFNPKTLNVQMLEGEYDNPFLDMCYRAEIDAHTGEIICLDEFAFQMLGHILEYDLKWY